MAKEMNSYELSRSFFDWCFENPELVSPNHTAIYFFAIEHCNRLGWKEKFGFPTQMAMDAIGIKKHQTYIKYLNELVEWGFIKMVQKSANQYSSNIISLVNALPKKGRALDKALVKHGAKQTESNGQSTGQSNSSIDKQENKEQYNNEQLILIEKLNEIKNSEMWIDTLCKNNKLDKSKIQEKLEEFSKIAMDEESKESLMGLKIWFSRWIRKQKAQESTKKTPITTEGYGT